MWPFKRKPEAEQPAEQEQSDPVERARASGLFSTHDTPERPAVVLADVLDGLAKLRPQKPTTASGALQADGTVAVMDTEDWSGDSTAKAYGRAQPNISSALVDWYGAQTFIGYQLAALIAQHWLIQKACAMPGRDAIRNGYTITSENGDELEQATLDKIKAADKKYALNRNLLEFVRFGRVFGIRICLFKVDYADPDDAYGKPFNLDGVRSGTYRGLVQIDPYWCSPELDGASAVKPDSMHFYEPTWWQINGRRYHRSHLVIYRNGDVADILKPAYLYGGIPVPQLIMERVYGAERTANEAPLLALTKRTTVYKTDLAEALTHWDKFTAKVAKWARFWSNNGVRVIGEGDEVQQIDTSLSDLDAVIMTQYQIVAAAAGVPSTKLLGTAPKGFNATGEFDESSYHEELESLQTHELTPLIERHHALVLRSEGVTDVRTSIAWAPLDSPTAKELAEINKLNAEGGAALVTSGAIDGTDERRRIANDKDSGYSGIAVADDALPVDPANPAPLV